MERIPSLQVATEQVLPMLSDLPRDLGIAIPRKVNQKPITPQLKEVDVLSTTRCLADKCETATIG
jgi:hypothetical protein